MADPYTPVHADWKDFPDTTTPVTAAALEQIEAGIVEAISRHIVAAKGDLIAATADNVVARLAVGARTGHALVVDPAQATGLNYGYPTFIGCRARRTTVQTLTTGVVTAINFDVADDYDTDAYHDIVTNNSRITIPTGLGGKYQINAGFRWTDNTTGDTRFAAVELNSTTRLATDIKPPGATQGRASHVISFQKNLVATDFLTLVALHSASGNLDISTASEIYLAVQFLGP